MRKILFSLFCATNLFAIDVQTLQSENSRELVHVESSLVSNSPQKTTIASCSEEEQAMLCLRKNLLSIYPELADEPALKVTSGLHWEQYALSLLYFQGLSPISQLNKRINNIFLYLVFGSHFMILMSFLTALEF